MVKREIKKKKIETNKKEKQNRRHGATYNRTIFFQWLPPEFHFASGFGGASDKIIAAFTRFFSWKMLSFTFLHRNSYLR